MKKSTNNVIFGRPLGTRAGGRVEGLTKNCQNLQQKEKQQITRMRMDTGNRRIHSSRMNAQS